MTPCHIADKVRHANVPATNSQTDHYYACLSSLPTTKGSSR